MNLFITNREIATVCISEMIRPDGLEYAGDNLRFGEYKDGKFILFPEPKTEMDIAYSYLKETNAESDIKITTNMISCLISPNTPRISTTPWDGTVEKVKIR